MYLLDTNACINFLRDPQSRIGRRLARVPYHEVALCSVVKAELFYGVQRSRDPDDARQKLTAFAAHFVSLPFDDPAAVIYGEIRAYLAQRGQLIGPNDMFIAATALAHQATLVTHNTREFNRVPGLLIEDWEA